MRANFCEYRDSAQIRRRKLGKYRPVHDLPGALAGYSQIHEISAARISEDVFERRLSAEHAADGGPPRAGAFAGGGAGGRGTLAHQADVTDDNAPALREFHPGLGLTADFSGRGRPLVEC